jgi:regulator of protease activity HflC (stomatin/prohibitin superfamily)
MRSSNTRNSTISSANIALYIAGSFILAVGAILFKPFVIVNAGERGVVMSFGKVQDRVLDEGIHSIVPIVTSVKRLNVRVQKSDINARAASKDLQDVTTDIAINWHIDPNQANKVYQQLGEQDQIVNGILTPAVAEVLKAATAKKNVEEILVKRTELKNEIDNQLKERLANYGLIVDDVSLVNFTFSPEFNQAIEAKQVAEQEAKQAEFIALRAKKEAEAEVNRARGQAEAQRLQRQTLTAELLQKQAIEKWDGRFPTVMGNDGALPFINLNLNETKQPK